MQIKTSSNLNAIMGEKEISFRQLEIMSGVSRSTLNHVANNKRKPSLDNLCRIALALQVTLDDLVAYEVDDN